MMEAKLVHAQALLAQFLREYKKTEGCREEVRLELKNAIINIEKIIRMLEGKC
jgi:hypothetical protein